MKLTEGLKRQIDAMSYGELLERWRFAPAGDPWFQGETGAYWAKAMRHKRETGADHVGASKKIGWDKRA